MNYDLLNQEIDSSLWSKDDFFQVSTPQAPSFDNQILTPPNSAMENNILSPECVSTPIDQIPLSVQFVVDSQLSPVSLPKPYQYQLQPYQNYPLQPFQYQYQQYQYQQPFQYQQFQYQPHPFPSPIHHQQYHQQQYQNSLKSSVSDHAAIQKDIQLRKENAKQLKQTEFVKLSQMSPSRIEQIKLLAQDKGILPSVVEAVLLLYTPSGRANYLLQNKKLAQETRLEGDDIYIKIVVNGGDDDDDNDTTNNSSPANKRRPRKSRAGHVKRPLNSFMLYRKSQTQSAMAYALHSQLKLNHQNISQIVGLMWQTEDKAVKDQFTFFANREKEIHKVLHPKDRKSVV